jgi:tRNA (guanine-N7-)-methyltransferase
MTTPKHHRPIRSFVLREGRMTPAQKNALDSLLPKYGISHEKTEIDFSALFGRKAPCYLEIGFGMGDSLAEMAKIHPENDYLGIEVHRPGVGSLLKNLQHQEINNVRVMCADAVDVLKNNIPDHSLDGVNIFFPDPWHKKKHNKRRIIQSSFIALIGKKLKPNGLLHIATDWEDYADHILSVMKTSLMFKNTSNNGEFSDRKDRPVTKFEKRGLRLDHKVWDLVFMNT